MRNLRSIALSFKKCMVQWRENPRMLFTLAGLWLLSSLYSALFISYVNEKGMVMGALEPFIAMTGSNNTWVALVFLCCIILIHMEAPFFSANDALLIPRIGRWNWAWGRILYILLASFLLPFLLAASMALFLSPFTFFYDKWSPAVVEIATSFETHDAITGSFSLAPAISRSIISAMSPLEATVWTCTLMGLAAAAVNMLMMVIGMSYNRLAGAGIGLALVIMGPALSSQLSRWTPSVNGLLITHFFEIGENTQNHPTIMQSVIYFIVLLWFGTIAMLMRTSRHSFKWGE